MMLTLLAYVVTLGVLITVHEYGHYRVAIACNVRVYRFSWGIGPVLWSRRFGKDDCEFALSAIPLGGYVQMLEKVDADTPVADSGRALNRRPLWQRAAVILAGPAANLALGIVLYAAAQWVGIQQIVPTLSQPPAGSMLAVAGLRSGDRVTSSSEVDADADGAADAGANTRWQDVRGFEDIFEAVAISMMDQRALKLQVSHAGETSTRTLTLPLDTLGKSELDADAIARIGLTAPYARPVLAEILANGPASRAGLKTGDVVLSVDGQPIADAQSLRDHIRAAAADGTPRSMQWLVERAGASQVIAVLPRVMSEDGKHFGKVDAGIGGPFEQALVRDDLVDSMRYGFVQTWRRSALSLRMFGRMLTGRTSVKNLSGPITIADAAGKSASRGLADFLAFLAEISVGIGVLNLLPIPVLDGGRLLYYLFEGATGRPVSTLWQTRLQVGGVLAILLLMSLALSNDVARLMGLQ